MSFPVLGYIPDAKLYYVVITVHDLVCALSM